MKKITMLLSLVFSVGLCGAISLPDIPEVDVSIDVLVDIPEEVSKADPSQTSMPEEISEADPSQTSMPEENITETDIIEEDTSIEIPTEIPSIEIPTIPTNY